ncbi:MAG TPA: HAD-IA family hydrolase [Gemmatimonadales bacterium]|nr:HAD-IA family hydrolase [Gemmatimonadales bacterium]
MPGAGFTHLFFDIGGVLGTNGWDSGDRAAARQEFGIEEDMEARHEEVLGDWETGQLDFDEYLDVTVFYRPRDFSREAFVAFMLARSQPDEATIALVARLHASARFTLMTMNNESELLNIHRIASFGLRPYFSAFLSSCWLGVRKPARRFFQRSLALAQADPARSLFVDDRPQNLAPATALGMQTVHFRGAGELERVLGEMGLL